jgi:hypothetical protein
MSTFLGGLGSNEFHLKNEGLAPMAAEKIKILGTILELPAKQHSHFYSAPSIFAVLRNLVREI